MMEVENMGIRTMQFESLSGHASVDHFISTRGGGFSAPPYTSLNLGLHVDDDPFQVRRNRERLALTAGIPLRYFTFAQQVHGCRIAVVTDDMRGMGTSSYDTALPDTDAMITNIPDICLTILVADCVPVLFYDPSKKVIGAAHAGWKGTVGRIAGKVVDAMQTVFSCEPGDILVGIGPSIGACCYRVGPDVASRFEAEFGNPEGILSKQSADGRWYLDLKEANRRQLLDGGIPDAHMDISEICTSCSADSFFSYRKEGQTGRFAAGIILRNELCASCTAIVCNWCSRP